MAAKVANAIIESYLTLHRDKTGEQASRIVELLNEEKRSREQEVEYLRNQVRDLARKITGHEPAFVGGDRDLVLHESPLSQFEQQRNQAEVEKAYLEAKLTAYRESVEADDDEIPAADLEKALAAHPGIQRLQSQIAMLKAQHAEYKRVARGKSADRLPQLVERIEEAEGYLTRHSDELRPDVEKELRKALKEGAVRAIAGLKMNIRNQQELMNLWQSKVDEHRKELEKTGDETLQLEFARADLLRSEEVLDRISDRIMALRTERKAPERAEILQLAAPPAAPLEALPYKKLGMAALGAFCIPFGLAFLWERWVRRISDAGQVSMEANLPVLAEISALPTRSSMASRLTANRFARDRATFEESIDALRVNLMLAPESKDLRTLVVTSAVSREGKTSLAASLAASLARSLRQPTLLIDADMRAPDLHEMFDAALEPGLAGVLDGACSLDDALITDVNRNVHFLPAGRLTVSPHLLLHSSRWTSLLSQASSRYRYVIIDAPPVLAASESLILASAAEGTLVCAMRDISRGPQLRTACERLRNAGARILGTIISGVPTQTWAYKYGGYGYGRELYAEGSGAVSDEASYSKEGHPEPGEARQGF
ncbi:MAG TPA: polysaccharide biosynthesis tyrosine autokinase [Pirellulales bacterium]|nr:polysaccharide biosynthesis tyrosine autokinase [Pirellulales bacterium]